MTTSGAEFVTHCLELLGAAGPSRARRMFGGHGLYVEDQFVALLIADTLYLRTDEPTREAFRAAGCVPFDYATRDGQRIVMAYWSAPQEAMESPALMLPWARLAIASALRAAASKRSAAPRKARATAPQAAALKPASVRKPGRAAKR